MKKKLACIVLLAALVVALPMYMKAYSLSVWAATDDGSDVHAPSMSVDSGEDPITDPETTVAPDRESDEISESVGLASDNSGNTEDDADDAQSIDEGVSGDALSAPEDKALAIAAGGSIIVLLGIVVFVVKKK